MYRVDLSDDERRILRAGLHQWLGPAHATNEIAATIGFNDVGDMAGHIHQLLRALDDHEPLTGVDWRRTLTATEIGFGSSMLGCALDWQTVTGFDDHRTLDVLRGLQRRLGGVTRGLGDDRPRGIVEVEAGGA